MARVESMMQAHEIESFLAREFPQAQGYSVTEVRPDGLQMRLAINDSHLRPGGTVSGPTMFMLADLVMYAAVLSRIGEVALAVTTGGNIDFMRKPAQSRDLLADCRLLKLGRVLAVGEVLIRSEGQDEPVARAAMTYSIPPK